MDEVFPVILGAILGAIIWQKTSGKLRFALSVAAVIVSGAAATIASGEYHESWVYLLLDFGEATLGLVVGYVAMARLAIPRSAGRAARPASGAP